MRLEDIPELPGYVSVARAAEILGMTKASVFFKIYEQEAFRHVWKLPGSSDGMRPSVVLLESEVREVARAAEKAAAEWQAQGGTLRKRLTDYNRRVKQWGEENGFTTNKAGAPAHDLVAAYSAAFPNDVRPK